MRSDRLRLLERAGDLDAVPRALADAQRHRSEEWPPTPFALVALTPPDLQPLARVAASLYPQPLQPAVSPAPPAAQPGRAPLHFDDHPAYTAAYLMAVAAWASGAEADVPSLDATWLESLRPSVPHDQNPAKQLALRFFGHIPLLWSEASLLAHVADDWRLRILRYAESAALAADGEKMRLAWSMARFPNFWTNALCIAQLTSIAPGAASQPDALQIILKRRRFETVEVSAPGDTLAQNALHLIYLGEVVALYLAALYGVDPSDRTPLQLLGID